MGTKSQYSRTRLSTQARHGLSAGSFYADTFRVTGATHRENEADCFLGFLEHLAKKGCHLKQTFRNWFFRWPFIRVHLCSSVVKNARYRKNRARQSGGDRKARGIFELSTNVGLRRTSAPI